MATRKRKVRKYKRPETMQALHVAYRETGSYRPLPSVQYWPERVKALKKTQTKRCFLSDEGAWQKVRRSVKYVAPLSTCEHCRAASGSSGGEQQSVPDGIDHFHAISSHEAGSHDFGFDERGFPLMKSSDRTTSPDAHVDIERETDVNPHDQSEVAKETFAEETLAEEDKQPFRLMDLTVELRKRIFELAFATPTGIVCVEDDILRPTEDFNASYTLIPYSCTRNTACFPCQLHYEINSMGGSGLSQASRQLHDETRLLPYSITTFSVHNLYYLFSFLEVIGPDARKTLRSLRFDWKLPTTETRALNMTTDVEKTWKLLDECTNLTSLEIDMHVLNLLWWHANGDKRDFRLDFLQQVPKIERLLVPRGLREVKFSWEVVKGLHSMEEWVKVVIGVWALPRGKEMNFDGVEAQEEEIRGGAWKRICWKAHGGQVEEEDAQIKEENAQIKEENAQVKEENAQVKEDA